MYPFRYMDPRSAMVGVVAQPEPAPPPPTPQPPGQMTDEQAAAVVNLWRSAFVDAAPLPGIGLPSQNKGVLTLTHTMHLPGLPPAPPMTINGLPSRSPLANNALGSFEISEGRWICLYETMLPDFGGGGGEPSSTQRYANALAKQGVDVAGNHYHWSGGAMMGRFALAIHSQTTGNMDPIVFTQAHLNAFRDFLAAVPRNMVMGR